MSKEKHEKKSQNEDEILDEIESSESSEESEESSSDEKEELLAKIAQLEEQKLRDYAEFENLKKRYEKEKAQAIAYAQESFARDMLSVIDALDSANSLEIDEENLKESLEKIKEGIELTTEQFKKIFSKHGIELITIEDGFDPNFHEAVMKVDSDDVDSGEIVQVFQKGYKYKDRVLRPAMVSIAN